MSEAPSAVQTWTRRVGRDRWLAAVVVALLVSEVFLAQAAVHFAPRGSSIAAYWPNSGISVVVLILATRRWRPATLAGVFVVTVLGNFIGGRDLEVAAGFGITNAAEAFLAYWLLTQGAAASAAGESIGATSAVRATSARSPVAATSSGRDLGPGQPTLPARGPAAPEPGPGSNRPRLDNLDDFIRLFVACGFAAALGGLLAGATVGLLEGGDALVTGRSVVASHLAAMLLIVPLAMRLPRDPQPGAGPLEILAQWATLTLIVVGVFFGGRTLPLVFIMYPILVWGALRFQPRLTALQLLVAGGAVAVLTTVKGGPYLATIAQTGQPPEAVSTLLQAHLLASALVTLPLAMMKSQRLLMLDDLTRSHEEIDAILAATTATAIVGISLSGRLEYVNVGTEQLTGYSAATLVGRARVHLIDGEGGDTVVGFTTDERNHSEPLRDLVDPLLDEAGGTFVQDWTFVRADGRQIVVSAALSRRYDATGAPAGFLAVAEDVTRRRRRERNVQDALASEKLVVDRLAQLDQSKNDFLATVSHELRTPITSILGYSQLLLGQDSHDLPAIQRQVVGRIERNGRRLMGLIEDMLAMSQIEVGSFGFTRVPLDVRTPLALAVESTLPLLPSRDLDLEQDVPEEQVLVAGDADKLERAFENLLSNAVKFSNPGEQVVVRLSATETEAIFSVTDTGIGIDSTDQAQLFERFFRGSEAHSLAIQGAGLGLSIAATIVSGHDGSIDIESAPGQGSTFTIRLPLLVEV